MYKAATHTKGCCFAFLEEAVTIRVLPGAGGGGGGPLPILALSDAVLGLAVLVVGGDDLAVVVAVGVAVVCGLDITRLAISGCGGGSGGVGHGLCGAYCDKI